jgi:hypothetical protein
MSKAIQKNKAAGNVLESTFCPPPPPLPEPEIAAAEAAIADAIAATAQESDEELPAKEEDTTHSGSAGPSAQRGANQTTNKLMDRKWSEHFAELQLHLQTHDALPNSTNTDNASLISWVHNQKKYAIAWEAGLPSAMTEERIELLRSVNFFQRHQTKWESIWHNNFMALKEHWEKVKNHNIGDPKVEKWLKKQGYEFSRFEKGEKTSLTRARIDLLDSIGVSFEENTAFDARIKELKAFKAKFGHVQVPKLYKPNPGLGRWCARTRSQYRVFQNSRPCPLSQDKIDALNEIGFSWTSTLKHAPNVSWEAKLNDLKAYKDRTGNTNVPKNYKDDKELASWTRNQRAQYMAKKRGKKSPMTDERIARLEEIGFEWKLK